MRKLMLKMSISLDGFCADSDPDDPQKWLFATTDDESNAWEISFLKDVGYHAMGHNTYRVRLEELSAGVADSSPQTAFGRSALGRARFSGFVAGDGNAPYGGIALGRVLD